MITRITFVLLIGLIAGLMAGFATSQPAQAQSRNVDVESWDIDEPWPIQRISGEITLDGFSDERAWSGVEPFPMTTYLPSFGLPPSEETEFLVAYDDDYMYFAMRAYESDPSGIRGNILQRDALGSDDYFEVMLDTFNDNENAVIFTTSPAGIRKDTEVLNDAVGSNGLNGDWNAHWDVAVEVTDEGWFAEIRVPFTTLRFRDQDGQVEMGLTAFRVIARKDEWDTFPPIVPNDARARLKPSRAQTVTLDGVYSRTPVYFTPYAVTGFARQAELEDDLSGYLTDTRREANVGGDVKIGLTNEFTLDLTVNTDFAQVEADDEQVNLTRFSLFFPEKRQFFQERSGNFDFNVGGIGRLFHSRRIGLTNDGRPVRILGGARLVGRVNDWDVGLLNMQTEETGGLPSENFGVLRIKRRAFNPYSYVGSMITSRIGIDGSYNAAYGLDGVVRVVGDEYLSLQWAQTFDDAAGEADIHSGRLSASFERRDRDGFAYASNLIWSGADFNPGVGFIRREDFTQVQQTLAYGWLPGASSPYSFHGFEVTGDVFLRNDDNDVETAQGTGSWGFTSKANATGEIAGSAIYENLLLPFSLSSDAHVPAGEYTFYQGALSYRLSRNRLIRTGVELEAGTFFDGAQVSAGVSPAWNVSPHLELEAMYDRVWIRFPDRDQRFDSHLAQLRVTTSINTQLSTVIYVQYNSANQALTTNARFRYNIREGNDLWIVYNEGVNTDRHRYDPAPPVSDSRAVLVKYTHTFQTAF
ncbi:MAG: DUF5916 domain-containing protein [Rhodothermales bacterium]